jgi:hypothetical protein
MSTAPTPITPSYAAGYGVGPGCAGWPFSAGLAPLPTAATTTTSCEIALLMARFTTGSSFIVSDRLITFAPWLTAQSIAWANFAGDVNPLVFRSSSC